MSGFGGPSTEFINYLHVDMRVRWDEDSSLLAGLYMFGDFDSEFGRDQLLFVAGIGSPWEPEGALLVLHWMFPWRVHLFCCVISTQRTDIGLCDQLFDLINYLGLLWDEGENVILLVADSRDCFPGTGYPRGYIIRLIGGYRDSL